MVILSGSPDPLAGFPAHDDDSGSPQATLVQLLARDPRDELA